MLFRSEIKNFTGVDDPYEVPENPEVVLDTMVESPEDSLKALLGKLKALGRIDSDEVHVTGERKHSGQTDLRIDGEGNVKKEH